ncbi:MAG: hypothetical protein QM726_10025 [Chitinophagaceae bacterium]
MRNYLSGSKSGYYSVRDIPIDVKLPPFYKTHYCIVSWNLQSPESDKVLNISRDKLIDKTKEKLEAALLNELLPTAVQKSIELFEKRYGLSPNNLREIASEYFNMELTGVMFGLGLNNNKNIYNEFKLTSDEAFSYDSQEVSFYSFLQENTFYLISREYLTGREPKSKDTNNTWMLLMKENPVYSGTVIADQNYLFAFLRMGDFEMVEYKTFKTEDKCDMTIKILKKGKKKGTIVTVNQDTRKRLHLKAKLNQYSKRRLSIIPITPFAEILAVNNIKYDGFGDMPYHCESCIISPFTCIDEFDALERENLDNIKAGNWIAIKESIKIKKLNQFVPSSLINWVIEHQAFADQRKATQDLIYESYLELICEMLKSNQS